MAGHSKFKNIQHRKGAQDAKRAKIFTKLVREIITSAKIGGGDAASNPRLRSAITNARAQNLPKERIERALKQAVDPSTPQDYFEMRYEGFASGGVGVIVEVLTDNKNRAAAEVRSTLSKYGGALGETGSVSFMFDHVGIITYKLDVGEKDALMELAIELGCIDVTSDEEAHKFLTEIEDFNDISQRLEEKLGEPLEAAICWVPKNLIEIEDEERAEKLLKLIDVLEDCDDVQKIFTNAEL